MEIISPEEATALISLVETGSYKAAANKMHKVQSALCYAIKKLENKLQIKIFEKHNNQMNLTNVGKVVYHKVLAINKINQELEKFSCIYNQGVESKLDIVVTAVTPTPILIEILQKLNNQFPQTQIELKFTTHEEPIDYLLRAEADIVISSDSKSYHNVDKSQWQKIDFLAVAADEHPAAFPEITEEDLLQMVNLVVGGKQTLAKKAPASLVESANVWHVTDFLLKKEFLLQGLGWGYMPKMLIERELCEGLLVPLSCKKVLLKDLFLARKTEDVKGPASAFLWNLFVEHSDSGFVHQSF
jgi:DNA-binding transcriptional LysR family regulator